MHTKHPPVIKNNFFLNGALHYINVQELFTYHRIVFLLFYIYTLKVVVSSIAVVWLTGQHEWSYVYLLYFDGRNTFLFHIESGSQQADSVLIHYFSLLFSNLGFLFLNDA